MKIVKVKDNKSKLADILLSVNVGWSHEPVGRRGISHFLEHSLFLGNEEHVNPDDETAKYGVTLNGETLPDRTVFFFSSLPEDAEDILKILLSLVYNPSFPSDKVEEEKMSKIITSIVQESDYNPWELAYEYAKNMVFKWDFHESMGTMEDLENIHIEELRVWHKKYYHGGNSILLVPEYINVDSLRVPHGKEFPERRIREWENKEIVVKKGLNNAELVYGFPLEKYDLRAFLLSTILGNYPTSLFWKEFHRDAYMVESRVEWHHGKGGFFAYIGLNDNDYEKAKKKFVNFIENLKITPEDLEIAKKIFMIETLRKERSSYKLFSLIAMDPELKFGSFREILEKIEGIEYDEMRDPGDILQKEEMCEAVVI